MIFRDYLMDKELMEYTEKFNEKTRKNRENNDKITKNNKNYNYNYLNFDLTLSHPLTITV